MTASKANPQLPYTYLELLYYCISRFLKSDFQECIAKWRPKEDLKALKRMKREELCDRFLSIVIETRARSLYRQRPEKFGLYRDDIKRFFHFS